MDANEKLRMLLAARGRTMYRLAKESNLSQNTIIHVFKRSTVPSIYTLEAVCRGSGITLSQFFAEEDSAELSPERKAMFDQRLMLTPAQKGLILALMRQPNGK